MRKVTPILLVLLGLSFAFTSGAQNDFPPVTNYSPKDYNNLSETSHAIKGKNFLTPENTSAIQDRRGVMYFGNANGVIEYDGEEWRFIEVKLGSSVRSLALDSNGIIFVGSFNEFGYLDQSDKNDIKYISLSKDLPEDEQEFTEIWNIECSNDKIYFQSLQEIFVYENGKLSIYKPENTTIHTAYLFNNQYFARVRKKGLCILNEDSGNFDLIPGGDSLANWGVFGVLPYKGNQALILTQEVGLWIYDGQKIFQHPSLFASDINNYGIYGGIQLKDGRYALNSFTNGVIIMNSEGQILQTINKRNGLRVNDVKSIFQDKNQNLWLPLGNGIANVNIASPLSFYKEKAGIYGNVQAIYRFKGNLFVGTSNGLYVQNSDPNNGNEFIEINAIKTQVWDIDEWQGVLLISTSEGIYSYDNGIVKSKWPYNTNALYVDTALNRIVSAGGQGIYTFYNGAWQPNFSFPELLSTMLSIKKNPNSIDPQYWIGSTNLGAFRLTFYDGFPMLERFTDLDGLNSDNLVQPFIFDNQVLFGSTSGILRFIDENEMMETLPDSLKDDPDMIRGMFDIYNLYDQTITDPIQLLKSDENKTWVCINNQVGYFDKNNNNKLVKKPFWGINLGRINTFYLEDNGVLWIGAADGMVEFKPNHTKNYKSKFSTILRRVQLANDQTLFYGSYFSEGKGANKLIQNEDAFPLITFDDNDITFHFAAPYFEDEHHPEYSFMLEGYEDQWSSYQANANAKYTNLDEGTYIFKVKARNIYGQESEVASYQFTILPPWYRTTWAYILYVILLIVIIFIAVKIASYHLKQKNAYLEEIVNERTQEIQHKNTTLLHQKNEIEDSINYALRIQHAILPLKEEILTGLKNAFVLFKPKDIVSGDFYWYGQIGDEHVFVCADCTGHGVPGAFMSMVCSDKLNQTIKEQRVTSPDIILSEVNKGIKKALKQVADQDTTRDGMDCAIVTVNFTNNTVKYSGANRSLWLVRNNELEETKATKVAVGGHTPLDQVFELHHIDIQKNDLIYLSSDGYADQFGGEKGKKMKVKNFKKKIMEIKDLPLSEQADLLDKYFEDWRGEHEQIDDVIVFGLKID